MKNVATATTLVIVVLIMTPSAVQAALISPQETAMILQSDTADGDLAVLGAIFGTAFQTLQYSAFNTSSGWTGTLTGAYLGLPVSLMYLGNLSGFPSGTITWTTSGTYGANTWTGSGSATIIEFPGGFTMNYLNNEAAGSHSAITTATEGISVIDPTDFDMNSTDGDTEITGSNITCKDAVRTSQERKNSFISVIRRTCRDKDTGSVTIQFINDSFVKIIAQNGDITARGTVSSTPEPATWFLVGGTLIGLFWFKRIQTTKTARS